MNNKLQRQKAKQIKTFRWNSLIFFGTNKNGTYDARIFYMNFIYFILSNKNGLQPRSKEEALSFVIPGSLWSALHTERFFLWRGLPVCTIFRLCNRPRRGWHSPVWTWLSTHRQGPKRIKTIDKFKAFLARYLALNNCRRFPEVLASEQAITISASASVFLRRRERKRPWETRTGKRSARGQSRQTFRFPTRLKSSRGRWYTLITRAWGLFLKTPTNFTGPNFKAQRSTAC